MLVTAFVFKNLYSFFNYYYYTLLFSHFDCLFYRKLVTAYNTICINSKQWSFIGKNHESNKLVLK